MDAIRIHGAREHNLKNITVDVPANRFVVITGVSGSGKSTLAFDILFAEGQRRFLESMNTYARQFVEQLARPDVDLIEGLPPTVSIEQRNTRGGGKSTVATVTEVHQFIRLLFARLGTQHCPDCELPVRSQTRDDLCRTVVAETKIRGDLLLLAPAIRNRKGFHSEIANWAAKKGYAELRADGKMYPTDKPFRLDRFKEHDVEVVTGVVEKRKPRSKSANPQPLIDETLALGKNTLYALDNHGKLTVHSTERCCPGCGTSFEVLDPKMFSYNSSRGWCPECRGFGELFYLPDVDRGARADAIEESWFHWQEGDREPCPTCHGARLRRDSLFVRLDGPAWNRERSSTTDIATLSAMTVEESFAYFEKIRPKGRDAEIARDILPEIRERLRFLREVGLGYLQMHRSVTTLSGGEAQRIRLAAQLGSNLSGVLYVLDEPTIGLHARDNDRLLDALAKLRTRGNSLIVVEHDEDTMRHADHIIDLGPAAGVHGGEVVAAGSLKELSKNPDSITGRCLQARHAIPARGERRPVSGFNAKGGIRKSKSSTSALTIHDADLHNLKKVTVSLPLNRFVVVTGVSGSGKSTLIRECLLPSITEHVSRKKKPSPPFRLSGHELIKSVHEVDQSPIGRTPRSTPATYVGFFNEIRQLFSQLPESRMRGYQPGRFSFNSKQGRCETCDGSGVIKMEMNFLPTAYVKCETCNGSRFNPETLDVELNGRNIAQVLDLSVEEAIEFFASFQRVKRPLEALRDTGLTYLKLGQTSPTLSGGEAQRLKLVSHLLSGLRERPGDSSDVKPHKLFLLEEPTIGLHISDVQRLVEVIQRLVDAGHSVIVIEHNMDLIAEADWVVDMGPEGGADGGSVVVTGTPEKVAAKKTSHTARYIRQHLERNQA